MRTANKKLRTDNMPDFVFCIHDDMLLIPKLITVDGETHVTSQCGNCRENLGEIVRLLALIDEAAGVKTRPYPTTPL